jgi:hypothetical protein
MPSRIELSDFVGCCLAVASSPISLVRDLCVAVLADGAGAGSSISSTALADVSGGFGSTPVIGPF